mgnify:CR=1 FL=1
MKIRAYRLGDPTANDILKQVFVESEPFIPSMYSHVIVRSSLYDSRERMQTIQKINQALCSSGFEFDTTPGRIIFISEQAYVFLLMAELVEKEDEPNIASHLRN